jgi:hypothetical protein
MKAATLPASTKAITAPEADDAATADAAGQRPLANASADASSLNIAGGLLPSLIANMSFLL